MLKNLLPRLKEKDDSEMSSINRIQIIPMNIEQSAEKKSIIVSLSLEDKIK